MGFNAIGSVAFKLFYGKLIFASNAEAQRGLRKKGAPSGGCGCLLPAKPVADRPKYNCILIVSGLFIVGRTNITLAAP